VVTDSELAALERKYENWNGKSTLLIMPTVLLALFALPVVIFHQNSLPIYILVSPLVVILAVFSVNRAARRWEDMAERQIAVHYGDMYLKTRWQTLAGAEGVVIEVSTFGDRLTLAFANGVTETYDRNMLVRITER
jgi:hypothetical protein